MGGYCYKLFQTPWVVHQITTTLGLYGYIFQFKFFPHFLPLKKLSNKLIPIRSHEGHTSKKAHCCAFLSTCASRSDVLRNRKTTRRAREHLVRAGCNQPSRPSDSWAQKFTSPDPKRPGSPAVRQYARHFFDHSARARR